MRSGCSATFVCKLMHTIAMGATAVFLLQLPGAG
jgi:hypothetical protein